MSINVFVQVKEGGGTRKVNDSDQHKNLESCSDDNK